MFIAGFTALAVVGTLAMIGVVTLLKRLARPAGGHTGTGNGPD
jgi:hypothetical protein